ncbi:MAG: lipoprotein-releasing system transmembrane subunit LolC [Gammaproteobacteria bacterium]|nr:lipoprotein-releasing system transmembrane subunit LolC [Gammaproteobacteria bacterium]
MYQPLVLFVGLRFVRARKKNQLMSFVSLISMLGIALGVLALIAVMSVINASTSTMRDETLKSVPHAELVLPAGALGWPQAAQMLQQQPGVVAAAPFIEGEAWLRFEGRGEFVAVRGIDPVTEPAVLQQDSLNTRQMLEALATTPDGIILGTRLASRLGLFSGTQLSVTPLASLLGRDLGDARSLRVLGVADFGFYDNASTALVNLPAAQDLFPGAAAATGRLQMRLRVDDVFAAATISSTAVRALPATGAQGGALDYQVSSWDQTRRSLFDALRMEKILTGFMLLMIVIIGAVNIVATLVMTVADKSADIAILRTMGAGRGTVMAVFVIQGLAAGVFGTALGALGGVALAASIGDMTQALQSLLNNALTPGDTYMIAHLQAELLWSDVALVCACALLISLLATLYPAWRASRIQPADVLRYE